MRARTGLNASRTLVLVLLMCLVTSTPVFAPPSAFYSIADLGAQTGTSRVVQGQDGDHPQMSFPRGINNAGLVVGRVGFETGANTRAVLWAIGGLELLGTLGGGDYSAAFAINDVGTVVGTANTGTAVRAVLWAPFGGVRELGALSNDSGSEAFGVNDAGDVVGVSSGSTGIRAIRWLPDGTIRNLGALSAGAYSRARAINATGEVVGTSSSPQGLRAVRWTTEGAIRNLGTLPGDNISEAFAINNAGYVVGYSSGARGTRAVLWTPAGEIRPLAGLPGGTYSKAFAINRLGDIVGTAASANGIRAVVWAAGGTVQDLNFLIPSGLGVALSEAHAINDLGQIAVLSGAGEQAPQASVGDNHQHEHVYRTYLLTPS